MGVLLAGFISAALASRLRIHYPLRMVVPRIGIYLGGIAGSLFALWAATSGPLAHGFKIKGPVAYAFLVAGIVAIVVFCWIGIPGYIHLSAPKAYPSSNPPSYALVVAGYLASLAFVATFAVLSFVFVIAWKVFGEHSLNSKRAV